MLNKAGFPEHTHVGWIARGLNNVEYIKYLGPLTNYESAPELLQHLVTASNCIDKKTNEKHEKRNDNPVMNGTGKKSTDIKCFKCKEKGHYSNKCPNTKRNLCFICKSAEHLASACPQRRKEVSSRSNASTSSSSSEERRPVAHINNKSDINTHHKYFKDGLLNGHQLRCYVDLGSGYTLVKKSFMDNLKLLYNESDVERVKGYGGGFVNVMGRAVCALEIDGVLAENVVVYVVPDNVQAIDLLLGHQFTERDDIRIVSDSSGLTISKVEYNDVTPITKGFVWAKSAMVIPRNFIAHVPINCELKNDEVCIEGSLRKTGEVIPRCLIRTNEHGDAVLPILNLTEGKLKLKQNQMIARGESCIAND